MLGKRWGRASKPAALCFLLGVWLAIPGCTTPTFNAMPGRPAMPTVSDITSHLKCALVRAMDDHLGSKITDKLDRGSKDPSMMASVADYTLWHRLADDNVLGTINLTLFVTESEGFNPAFNSIQPLTSAGNPMAKIIESSNGVTNPTGPTSNTFNLTLSAGGSLAGTQDRNFVLNYVIDMHRLYDATYPATIVGKPPPPRSALLVECVDPAGPRNERGLRGDLDIQDILAKGLHELDAQPYAPVTSASGAAKAVSATVSQTAGATAFSTKVDFTLAWGVNGGPSWTLLEFKGPTGTNPFLSYSRSKMDTLIATFSATCRADTAVVDLANLHAVYKPSVTVTRGTGNAPTTIQVEFYRRRVSEPASKKDAELATPTSKHLKAGNANIAANLSSENDLLTVVIPSDNSGLSYVYTSTATGVLSIDPLTDPLPKVRTENKNGTIAWSGFWSASGYYQLRGAITDIQSGSYVGGIYLDVGPDPEGGYMAKSLVVSQDALLALLGEDAPGPADYWASLPTCANAGPFLPNSLTVLQQLPGTVSDAFRQSQ